MSARGWLRVGSLLGLLLLGRIAARRRQSMAFALWSGPEGTRVVFELSGPVEHRVFALGRPRSRRHRLPRSPTARPLAMPDGQRASCASVRAGAAGRAAICASCSSSTPPRRRRHSCWRRTSSTAIGSSSTCRPGRVDAASVRRAPHAPSVRARPSSSRSTRGMAARIPGRAGAAGVARKTSCSRSRAASRTRSTRPGMRAVLDARRRLLRAASQAHGDRARRRRRTSSCRSTPIRIATAMRPARRSTCCRSKARERRGSVAARAARERVRPDRRRLARRQGPDCWRACCSICRRARPSARARPAGQRLIRRMSAVTSMRAPAGAAGAVPRAEVAGHSVGARRDRLHLESARGGVAAQPAVPGVARHARCVQGIVDYFAANPPQGSYFARLAGRGRRRAGASSSSRAAKRCRTSPSAIASAPRAFAARTA